MRTSVEGINTTEGTGGAGFYYDYGSFEEVFLGVAGQGAEAATPGVQSNFLGKSGGNKFSGDFYIDGYNNSFQSSNLSEIYTRPTAQGGYGFREGSNEVLRYYDVNFNVGGPIKKDKAWWNFSWRRQFNAVEQPLFSSSKSFDTWNQNPSAKVTVPGEPEEQDHRLLPVEHEGAAEPSADRQLHLRPADATSRQVSPSWVYKGEWNGTVSAIGSTSKRAGVTSAITIRATPTAMKITSGATPRCWS